jgi:hypothetical protein
MSLIKELLALQKPTPTPVVESSHMFDDVDVIKFDPDRTDSHDIVNGIMGVLVKMAYVNLLHSKEKHEKMYDDPEDEKFKFTTDELADEVDAVIGHVKDRLGDLSSADIKDAIKAVSSSFKQPLDK